ncbi:hypothetical protein [Rubinisphaera italica]|uniref:Uncharacterized protein n=1 Tax=Rubinisphaera italica TaxID=2527969 RepID=A0A5C5XGR2_9PLAN|nr:hypothetical protein [Rubinisphaera italica]TWT62267.1 hypothetical protein Pan54_30080 [Rubinisphaera italica]
MDYCLKPLSKTCSYSGEPLQPGDLCYSVLVEKNGRFERLDFSSAAWQGVPEGALGVWRTEVPEPESKPAGYLDLDRLYELFTEYCEQANDYQKKLRYVLALLLVRKKQLIHEQTTESEGLRIMQLQGARGEGTYEITEEALSQSEVARLEAEIQTLGQQPLRNAA